MTTRIDPAVCIRPGRRDPLLLLTAWFMRKSFYWTLWLGLTITTISGDSDRIADATDSPNGFADSLLSPLVIVIAALLFRFASSQMGLLITYPLAKGHEVGLAPRTNFGKSIGIWLDRLHVMRAYRSMRWTHHVRQVAIRQLGDTGSRLARLDPIMDIANIAGIFVWVLVAVIVGSD